jgi:hypothetical protein
MPLISWVRDQEVFRGRHEKKRSTGFFTEQSKLNRIRILSGNWAEADLLRLSYSLGLDQGRGQQGKKY